MSRRRLAPIYRCQKHHGDGRRTVIPPGFHRVPVLGPLARGTRRRLLGEPGEGSKNELICGSHDCRFQREQTKKNDDNDYLLREALTVTFIVLQLNVTLINSKEMSADIFSDANIVNPKCLKTFLINTTTHNETNNS